MQPSTIAIIGGGIAGLTAARELTLAAPTTKITLLEASPRLGGKVRTQGASDGARLEFGPDAFLASAKPAAAALARDLGLDLVSPGPLASKVYLLSGGRLRALPRGLSMGVPTGIGSMLGAVASGVLSPTAAMRAGLEPFLPRSVGRARAGEPDVTVAHLTRARLGQGAADRLVTPLITGVFGASPEEIGADAAFPQLASERSLVLAMARRGRDRGEGPMFLAPREGMGSLVDALAAGLADAGNVTIELSREVTALSRGAGGAWSLDCGDEPARRFDSVIVAVPPAGAARLLGAAAAHAARPLATIRTSASAVVFTRHESGTLGRPLDASGLLVAPGEPYTLAAATFLPAKWPHAGWRDPWIRSFVTSPEHLTGSDDELARAVGEDLERVLESSAGPVETLVHRWLEALPVQAPGHRERLAAAAEALPRGLSLAGAAYLGSGIPDAVSSGSEAASRTLSGV